MYPAKRTLSSAFYASVMSIGRILIALASVAPLRAMFSRRSSRLLRSCERGTRELAVHVAIALLTECGVSLGLTSRDAVV